MIPGAEELYQVRRGALCFGVATRGGVVVAAAPCARWAVGRVWPDVVAYYQKRGARVARVDLVAVAAQLDPPRAGPVTLRSLDPASGVVAGFRGFVCRRGGVEGDDMGRKKAKAAKQVHADVVDIEQQRPLAKALARPLVQHVKSDVQGGVDCRLGRLTLIVGSNATMKSAVVRAVELALTGAASDMRWRDVTSAERDLLRLTRAGKLSTEVSLSDGKVSRFSIGEDGGRKGVLATPYAAHTAAIFPLRALREALLGKPETARKFFLRFAVGTLTVKDVRDRVANTHHARLATVGLTDDTLDVVDALIAAIDECGKRARGEAKKAGTVEQVANTQSGTLAPEPTQEQMAQARARLTTAQRYYTVASLAVSHRDTIEKIAAHQREVTELRARLVETEARFPAALPGAPAAAVGPIEVATVALLDYHVQHGLAMCVCCGAQGVPTAEFARRRDALMAASAETTRLAGERGQALAWAQQARNRIEVLDGLIVAFGAEVAEVQRAVQEWNGVPSVEWAKGEYDAAQTVLGELERAAGAWKVVHQTQKQGTGAETIADAWKSCGKELKRVAAELLGGGVEAFRARVQRYLTPGDTFVLEVDDKSVELGLKGADGELNTVLGGAEGVRVTLALAAAISEGVPADVPVLLVPDDRGFDPATLEATMRALEVFDGQVVIATPTMPPTVPEGWVVVHTDKGEHRLRPNGHGTRQLAAVFT